MARGLVQEKKEERECPYCGRMFIEYKCVAKKFCSGQCFRNDRASRRITKRCIACGADYRTYISKDSLYCSKQCKLSHSQEKLKKRITKSCEYCMQQFEVTPSRKTQRFCSLECTHLSNPKNLCKICGEEIKRQNKLYCSIRCLKIDYAIRLCGKDNPNWKGGDYDRENGGIGTKHRQRILERDSYRCRECGTEDKPSNDLYPGLSILYIHHLVPLNEGGKTEDDNLITLCIICHYEGVHGYTLKQMVHDFAAQQGCRSPYLRVRGGNSTS